MGTRAERFTGYFSTSASNRAASSGEKGEDFCFGLASLRGSCLELFSLIASTPAPMLQLSCPALLHRWVPAACPLQSSRARLFLHFRATSRSTRPCVAIPAISSHGVR